MGARGPRPQPTVLKLLRGNPSQRRIRPEPMPRALTDIPEPPDYLEGYGREEWLRIAPELYRLGCLTVVDLHTLAAYCQSYFEWRNAIKALANVRSRDPTTLGIMFMGSSGTMMANPIQFAAERAAKNMVRYASEFGCTPAARSRIAAAEDADGGKKAKFSGLLAGV